jgi:hypothetical protein
LSDEVNLDAQLGKDDRHRDEGQGGAVDAIRTRTDQANREGHPDQADEHAHPFAAREIGTGANGHAGQ